VSAQGDWTRVDPSSTSPWIELKRELDKSGAPKLQYGGWFFVHDESNRAVVQCGYSISQDSESVRARYKDICSSLALARGSTEAKLAAREAKPDSEVSDVPHFEELAKAAGAFHAAVRKGDMQAMKTLLLGPADCALTVPPEKVAECKQEMATMMKALEKELGKLREGAAKTEPTGWHLMLLNGGGKLELWFAYPSDAAHPCKVQHEIAWPVAWVGNRAAVAILPMKKEAPSRKK
jgi:hypothetical protein